MDIKQISKEIHENAIKHGWHDEERSFGEFCSLLHSEISEAFEEHRNNREPREIYFNGDKPEGIPIELADLAIRLFDTVEKLGIDIEKAIALKHEFNKTRTYRHGGKRC